MTENKKLRKLHIRLGTWIVRTSDMQRRGLGWGCSNPRIWYKLLICPSDWTSGLWRFLFYLSFHFFPLSSCPVYVSSICMRIECDHFHDRLKASAICSSFEEERNFKLMCIEFSSSWSFQSITFLQSVHELHRLKK